MGKWAKVGLIAGAVIGLGVAVYIRHNGYYHGKMVMLGILLAGYGIGSLVDKRLQK